MRPCALVRLGHFTRPKASGGARKEGSGVIRASGYGAEDNSGIGSSTCSLSFRVGGETAGGRALRFLRGGSVDILVKLLVLKLKEFDLLNNDLFFLF